jgi:hypothetical protein
VAPAPVHVAYKSPPNWPPNTVAPVARPAPAGRPAPPTTPYPGNHDAGGTGAGTGGCASAVPAAAIPPQPTRAPPPATGGTGCAPPAEAVPQQAWSQGAEAPPNPAWPTVRWPPQQDGRPGSSGGRPGSSGDPGPWRHGGQGSINKRALFRASQQQMARVRQVQLEAAEELRAEMSAANAASLLIQSETLAADQAQQAHAAGEAATSQAEAAAQQQAVNDEVSAASERWRGEHSAWMAQISEAHEQWTESQAQWLAQETIERARAAAAAEQRRLYDVEARTYRQEWQEHINGFAHSTAATEESLRHLRLEEQQYAEQVQEQRAEMTEMEDAAARAEAAANRAHGQLEHHSEVLQALAERSKAAAQQPTWVCKTGAWAAGAVAGMLGQHCPQPKFQPALPPARPQLPLTAPVQQGRMCPGQPCPFGQPAMLLGGVAKPPPPAFPQPKPSPPVFQEPALAAPGATPKPSPPVFQGPALAAPGATPKPSPPVFQGPALAAPGTTAEHTAPSPPNTLLGVPEHHGQPLEWLGPAPAFLPFALTPLPQPVVGIELFNAMFANSVAPAEPESPTEVTTEVTNSDDTIHSPPEM